MGNFPTDQASWQHVIDEEIGAWRDRAEAAEQQLAAANKRMNPMPDAVCCPECGAEESYWNAPRAFDKQAEIAREARVKALREAAEVAARIGVDITDEELNERYGGSFCQAIEARILALSAIPAFGTEPPDGH